MLESARYTVTIIVRAYFVVTGLSSLTCTHQVGKIICYTIGTCLLKFNLEPPIGVAICCHGNFFLSTHTLLSISKRKARSHASIHAIVMVHLKKKLTSALTGKIDLNAISCIANYRCIRLVSKVKLPSRVG